VSKKHPFVLVYAAEVKRHLRSIEKKYHLLIREAVETQLLFQPDVETRNRKPLEKPLELGADWELRLGPDNRFRAFYTINPENHEVRVLAVGVKQRSQLLIGGEEVQS